MYQTPTDGLLRLPRIGKAIIIPEIIFASLHIPQLARFNDRRAPLGSRLDWPPPSALEAGAVRLWWLSWFGNLNRHRDREVDTYHRHFTLL